MIKEESSKYQWNDLQEKRQLLCQWDAVAVTQLSAGGGEGSLLTALCKSDGSCPVAGNLEFSFNSLLPLLTLWGFFFVYGFFRELVLLWKQQTLISAAWVLLVLLCVPESNEYKFKSTVNALCDAAWCTYFCFCLLGLCGTRSCHLLVFCVLLCCILRDQKPKQTTG